MITTDSNHFGGIKGWWKSCDALRDLGSFVQFKKRENTHGGVLLLAKLLKVTLHGGCFSRFF